MAAKRVPELRLPVRHQAIARAMRPPSSGNAGTRLKISTKRLIEPSQAIMTAAPEALVLLWASAAWRSSPEAAITRKAPTQASTIAAVTRGPAIAILNSVPGVSESFSSRAKPPNIHSVIPETPIPCRRATKAWPSSCSRIEAKKSAALATARKYGALSPFGELSSSR